MSYFLNMSQIKECAYVPCKTFSGLSCHTESLQLTPHPKRHCKRLLCCVLKENVLGQVIFTFMEIDRICLASLQKSWKIFHFSTRKKKQGTPVTPVWEILDKRNCLSLITSICVASCRVESTQPTTELLSTTLRDVTLRVKKLKCEFLKTFSACFNARLSQSQSHEVTRRGPHGERSSAPRAQAQAWLLVSSEAEVRVSSSLEPPGQGEQ